MVKSKGFTLIEIMVVVAILGILASMVVGPIKNSQTTLSPNHYDSSEDTSEATLIINGVAHECDTFGNCEKVD